jgi:predicted ATPase
MGFAALLRRYRLERALTQEELAARANLSLGAVSYLERGLTHLPHQDTVRLLSEALGLSEEDAVRFQQAARTRAAPDRAIEEHPASGVQLGGTGALPELLAPLIGREREDNEIVQQLAQEHVRLLTLTGPAGVGKTRLAIQAARRWQEQELEVAFVDLIPIAEPDQVLTAIAAALGVREHGARALRDELRTTLARRRLLLVLDNFEQLLGAARLVVDLLGSCPRVKALVTSREALHVRGEYRYPVSPLSLPERGAPAPTAIERSGAGALFLERARAVRPDFALETPEQAELVASICKRLDGLPLAIELAAARLRHLSLRELCERLVGQSPLVTLIGGARDLADHQRAMRATIAWSYQLLSGSEQELFRRLSVFAGGATVEAVEAVSGVTGEQLQDLLNSLVDKHLVRWSEIGGTTRFSQLVIVQAYAAEQLCDQAEETATRELHAIFYLELVRPMWTRLWGSDQAEVLDQFELELDNVRAAMRWARERRAIELGLALADAVWLCCHMRGYLSEGRSWFDLFLEPARAIGPAFDAKLLSGALDGAGTLAYDQGDLVRAEALVTEGLEIRRNIGYDAGISSSSNNLALILEAQGEYARARALHEENIVRAHANSDETAMANSLVNLAGVAAQQGSLGEALGLYEKSLALFKQTGDTDGRAEALSGLAELALNDGDAERARRLCAASLHLWRGLGDTPQVALVYTQLGEVAYLMGDHQAAAAHWRDALQLAQATGRMAVVLHGLERLAWLCVQQGRTERAAHLCGAAAALRSALRMPVLPLHQAGYEETLTAVHTALGATAFAAAWSEGQELSLDAVLALALTAAE